MLDTDAAPLGDRGGRRGSPSSPSSPGPATTPASAGGSPIRRRAPPSSPTKTPSLRKAPQSSPTPSLRRRRHRRTIHDGRHFRGEGVRATTAVVPRRAHPGAGADRAAHAHHRAVRDRRGERAAAGGTADERDGRRAGGVQERLHRGRPPRRRHRRCHLGDGGDLHPPRRRCADRHVEHGRHDPHRRLLRHRPAPAGHLLRRRRPDLRRRRGGHRQLLDHRRHPRRGVRRHGTDPRHVDHDRRRSRSSPAPTWATRCRRCRRPRCSCRAWWAG